MLPYEDSTLDWMVGIVTVEAVRACRQMKKKNLATMYHFLKEKVRAKSDGRKFGEHSAVIRQNSTDQSNSIRYPNVRNTYHDFRLHSKSLIKNIAHWNPRWLSEQERIEKPPPLVYEGSATLPLKFLSYDSYMKSFFSMIVLEVWESVFRATEPLRKKSKNWNKFYYIITSVNRNYTPGLMRFHCESIVNENFYPSEGYVVLLKFKKLQGQSSCAFGYINYHKTSYIRESQKLDEWVKIPEELRNNSKLCLFSVVVKSSLKNLNEGSVNLANGIINIKHKQHLMEALLGFKESPLQRDILRPSREIFSFYDSNSGISQAQLIKKISEEITKECPKSKTILINAPPGTGKTSAVIGIVDEILLYKARGMKIVLSGPTDRIVDKMGLLLIELNERYSWKGHPIKFVRLGQADRIHNKLKRYTLENKVSNMFKKKFEKEFQEHKRSLKILEDKINRILKLKHDKYGYMRIDDNRLNKITSQLQDLKKKRPLDFLDPLSQATYEHIILQESQIFLLTLNTCMQPHINKFFKYYVREERVCIIDGAPQCTEPEILQCLNRKVTRLILVGDIKQLPPSVISSYAIKWGFQRSLMERLLILFSKQYDCFPSLTMTKQYRMKSKICHFLSRHFYDDKLKTNIDIDKKCKYSFLSPLIIFDIFPEEMSSPSVDPGHDAVASICSHLLQETPRASIGVIVTSEYKTSSYRASLYHNKAFRKVEINTVEKFCGSEKDIIIIACFRPFLPVDESFVACERKMNVSLTRARECLIVCGHISTLMQYEHWNLFMNHVKACSTFYNGSALQQMRT
ncbi:probable helicase senataxin [Nephila pilipes]|uniref:Probable helicase senataxin n=1 Tax=Nephila pilipes TaxID=299642 RepID=A0A8X6QZI8_NEPPI|nr:probable helicase senataxin [Nephila pilipes]